AMFPNYSEDPSSPYFIKSLSYTFERGSAETGEFMTKAGMCMGRCPADELDLYTQQYPAQLEWYLANKDTAPTVPTTEAPVPTTTTTTTTTAAPVPTGNPGGYYPFKPNGACVAGCTNS
ncbi:hypothetical protein BGZ51_001609, partial [Haplosporangium sp. Z 767]